MNKAVEQRYQNADDLIGDLTRFRRFLAQYKKQLREEARRTLSQVTDLAHQNEELFSREGISSPSKRLTDSLERDDVSYMSLVGLKDGASLHLRRLEKLVESAARASARDSDRTLSIYEATWTGMRPMSGAEQRDAIRADEKLEAAETSFSTGDLAGSLRLVCDALRIAPAHQRAEQLAERIRIGIVRLADVLAPPPGPTQVEVLVAALLAIGETGAEQAMLHSESSHDHRTIAGLSDVFLSGLPSERLRKRNPTPKTSRPARIVAPREEARCFVRTARISQERQRRQSSPRRANDGGRAVGPRSLKGELPGLPLSWAQFSPRMACTGDPRGSKFTAAAQTRRQENLI